MPLSNYPIFLCPFPSNASPELTETLDLEAKQVNSSHKVYLVYFINIIDDNFIDKLTSIC